MSADLYSDLTNGLGMKNYPKMTPHMLQSAQWLQSYKDFFIMSADLYTDLTIVFDSKITPKGHLKCPNPFTGSKVMLVSIFQGGAILLTITA